MQYNFQINLLSIIDLLSNNLYSSPQVFLRELLQNGVDAIRARTKQEPEHQGKIDLEVILATEDSPAIIVFNDNGIGLTESEVHQFLATIGQSSKKDTLARESSDFIGQFGIGLLSCFVVSDEIVVLTRSIKEGAKTIEWKGRKDGTYTIRELDKNLTPGTRVYLRSKPEYTEYFQAETVTKLARNYGSLLPFDITVNVSGKTTKINENLPIWQQYFATEADKREAILEYGKDIFEQQFVDYIPLTSSIGGVEGIAFILPYSPSPSAKTTHRVYLKRMLLGETISGILPEWAFFVKCVVNVNSLRPTASRESFYEDASLIATRSALGQCLKDYLVRLSQSDRSKLEQLISLHYLAIKGLAVHDDEFYQLIIDWLPFDTSLGRMTLADYCQQNSTVRYVSTCDQFRQIAGVAASQNICVINAGYVYDRELLAKLPSIFPDRIAEKVEPTTLTSNFEDLTLEERETVFQLIKTADLVLQPFKCAVQIKKFLPQDLPALYSTGEEGTWQRNIMQTQEVASDLWSDILGNINSEAGNSPYGELCLNFNNSLISKLAKLEDKQVLKVAIEMLYAQSLLLGHHPLSSQEMQLLNKGLLGLIELSISNS